MKYIGHIDTNFSTITCKSAINVVGALAAHFLLLTFKCVNSKRDAFRNQSLILYAIILYYIIQYYIWNIQFNLPI